MIKQILKKILQYYLKFVTKMVLFIYRPTVIAIAGSSSKVFVKDEINRVLRESGVAVRSNPKSFNTEIGLPLAILNLPSGYNSYIDWLPVIWKAFLALFRSGFPRYLVLELGVSDVRDMKYLLSIIKPEIAVITDITQRYLEGFGNMDELVGEYEYLVSSMSKDGLAVLNYDNFRIKQMSESARCKIIFYGFNQGADWQAKLISHSDSGQKVEIKSPSGTTVYNINRHGQHHIYASLAGAIIRNYVELEKKKI